MTTIKAQVEIEIFDDPEYCRNDNGECEFFSNDHSYGCCFLFDEIDLELEYDSDDLPVRLISARKGKTCKAAYQKALPAHEPIDCSDTYIPGEKQTAPYKGLKVKD